MKTAQTAQSNRSAVATFHPMKRLIGASALFSAEPSSDYLASVRQLESFSANIFPATALRRWKTSNWLLTNTAASADRQSIFDLAAIKFPANNAGQKEEAEINRRQIRTKWNFRPVSTKSPDDTALSAIRAGSIDRPFISIRFRPDQTDCSHPSLLPLTWQRRPAPKLANKVCE